MTSTTNIKSRTCITMIKNALREASEVRIWVSGKYDGQYIEINKAVARMLLCDTDCGFTWSCDNVVGDGRRPIMFINPER